MRIMSVLLALLLVGYLAQKQLASNPASTAMQDVLSNESSSLPNVPASVKDVKKFEIDMNKLMKDEADTRAKLLEESLGR